MKTWFCLILLGVLAVLLCSTSEAFATPIKPIPGASILLIVKNSGGHLVDKFSIHTNVMFANSYYDYENEIGTNPAIINLSPLPEDSGSKFKLTINNNGSEDVLTLVNKDFLKRISNPLNLSKIKELLFAYISVPSQERGMIIKNAKNISYIKVIKLK